MNLSKVSKLNLLLPATALLLISVSELPAKVHNVVRADSFDEAVTQAFYMPPIKKSFSAEEGNAQVLRALQKTNMGMTETSNNYNRIGKSARKPAFPSAQNLMKSFVYKAAPSKIRSDLEQEREELLGSWEKIYQNLLLKSHELPMNSSQQRAYNIGLREFGDVLNEAKIKLRTSSKKFDEQSDVYRMGVRRAREGLEKFIGWSKGIIAVSSMEEICFKDWIREAKGKKPNLRKVK